MHNSFHHMKNSEFLHFSTCWAVIVNYHLNSMRSISDTSMLALNNETPALKKALVLT